MSFLNPQSYSDVVLGPPDSLARLNGNPATSRVLDYGFQLHTIRSSWISRGRGAAPVLNLKGRQCMKWDSFFLMFMNHEEETCQYHPNLDAFQTNRFPMWKPFGTNTRSPKIAALKKQRLSK
jgi:hypothetical protein